ncbi:uncharacterized protein LOC106134406 [Amyelois transitella]|nr:uncharacterized protein LOC106134406 [Amyelois transitella]
MSMKRTGGGPPENGFMVSDNVIDTICPFINLRVPGVIDSNTIEILADTIEPNYGKNLEFKAEKPTVKDDMKKPEYGKIPELQFENATAKVIDLSTEEQTENHSRKRPIFAQLQNEIDENSYLQPKRKSNKDTFSTPTSSKKFLSETEARVKRSTINIQQDQALHELRIQREKILIERENNLLEYEKKIHEFQIQKIKLEIELLNKQIGN